VTQPLRPPPQSALCTEIKGYIYVEAYKEAHVREATQGMNGLFFRITQVREGRKGVPHMVRLDVGATQIGVGSG
jgi:hypothetical protein